MARKEDFKWPKVTVRSKLSLAADIKGKLSDEGQEMFRLSPFGDWLDYIHTRRGDPSLIVCFLEKQVEVVDPAIETLYYRIGQHQRRYGREEFMLLMGLPFGIPPALNDWNGNSFIRRLFPHTVLHARRDHPLRLKVSDLMALYGNMSQLDVDDVVRICSLVMVEKVFLGRQSHAYVDPVLLNAVHDLDVWNEYPWGSYIWTFTYKHMDGAINRRMDQECDKMTIYGFLHAFEIWILEMFPISVKHFSRSDAYPRAFRWEKKKKILTKNDVLEFFNFPNEECYPRESLVADEWEQQQGWYRRSHEWFQHVASARPPKRQRRVEVAHGGDDDDDPMDVDPYQDKWVTLERVDTNYIDLARRMKVVEDEMDRMRVSGRHSVSDARPTMNYGSTPVHYSQQEAARQSFHTSGAMGSASHYTQPAYTQFAQSSNFGMPEPSMFIPTPNIQVDSTPPRTESLVQDHPVWGLAAEILSGTGSAFSTFGQAYGGMCGPSGSSHGAVIPSPNTTLAERDIGEIVPHSDSTGSGSPYQTESNPDPGVDMSPRPHREKRPGEKVKSPWMWFGGKGKGKR